jgi:hypothetical protein
VGLFVSEVLFLRGRGGEFWGSQEVEPLLNNFRFGAVCNNFVMQSTMGCKNQILQHTSFLNDPQINIIIIK